MLDEETLAAIAAALPEPRNDGAKESPFLSIEEAAAYARTSRQRIYDLRSNGRLSRIGDGARGLVLRSELDALIANGNGG